MPELPEVQTIATALTPRLVNRRIEAIPHLRSDMLQPQDSQFIRSVVGRQIIDLRRRAKRIVFQIDNSERFYIHLGMTGHLSVQPPAATILKHTHLIIDLDNHQQLRFVDPRRFGAIVWMGMNDHTDLGPEPLTLRPERLRAILLRTNRAIKTALLDQTLIAGIGNIYADEALFYAKIHPLNPACSLSVSQIQTLNRSIKLVLRRAISAGGSTIRDYVNADGDRGTFQMMHRVYERTDERCYLCKSVIVCIRVGGRSTHFCPKCQKNE